MASTRKPTYRPGPDSRPGAARPGSVRVGSPRAVDKAEPEAVISAQRSLEPERTTATAKQSVATGKAAASAGSPDNVIVFPEPKGRRRRRLVLWTLSIVAAVVAAVIAGAIFSPALAVRTVTVDGTTLLTPQDVEKALSGLDGKPLPQVSEEEINELLKPLVQVRSATMEARPPSELLVHVNERVPVALLKQGDSYVMVDVDGVQLGATKDQSAVALPLIDAGAGSTNTELFKAIAAVLDTLPTDVRAKMSTASAASADAVELKLVDGKTVVWGNAEDKELKAKALEALLKMPADPKVPVSVYDVSVPRHPFTK